MIITGVARSEKTEAAAPAASGSPLVPQMPRRPVETAQRRPRQAR